MTVKQLTGNHLKAEISLNCVPQCLRTATSGDFSSTAEVSTWISLGEPWKYNQVEGREKKARHRKEGAGRS